MEVTAAAEETSTSKPSAARPLSTNLHDETSSAQDEGRTDKAKHGEENEEMI
jgi:hypothetical protein